MGALGDWVVLYETTGQGRRYFLRYDDLGRSGVTEHWMKLVDIAAPRRFVDDAREFVKEDHRSEYSGASPYNDGTPLAHWSPHAGGVFVLALSDRPEPWSEQLRAYIEA